MKHGELRNLCNEVLSLCNQEEWLERQVDKLKVRIEELEAENRKLKYEYEDSLLERDTPLPYAWELVNGYLREYCPKCGAGISNWQRYCHDCGQKIKDGNPEENMMRRGNDEGSNSDGSGS